MNTLYSVFFLYMEVFLEKTTVCYIKRLGFDDEFLFMFRNKKKNDINHGKFIGIGGHLEELESYDDCNIREVYEETGLKLLNSYDLGIVHFYDGDFMMDMRVYFSDDYEGDDILPVCSEGELRWLKISDFYNSPHFVGDEYFLKYVFKGESFGDVTLKYNSGILNEIIHNGQIIDY